MYCIGGAFCWRMYFNIHLKWHKCLVNDMEMWYCEKHYWNSELNVGVVFNVRGKPIIRKEISYTDISCFKVKGKYHPSGQILKLFTDFFFICNSYYNIFCEFKIEIMNINSWPFFGTDNLQCTLDFR